MADETTREPESGAQVVEQAEADTASTPLEHAQRRLEAAWRQIERLESENDWLRNTKGQLAEIDRLRAELAAALEIVRTVAEATVTHSKHGEYARQSRFHFPGLETAAKIREQARALLAPTEGATEGQHE